MLVLHPVTNAAARAVAADSVSEASNLAGALDLDVRDARAVDVSGLRAGTYFGKGKVAEIADAVAEEEIGLVVINGTLSPVQQRNLERAWKTKVLDRTGLILEIFGDRARTREGALQVELAHLDYQKSRLVRSWTHLERQRGGVGFLGGPGETQIEADRRALGERIHRIKQALKRVARTRGQHRAARRRVPFPVVALVGYTNAGKSLLFNRLTGANVMSRDMPFATLDPTMRAVDLSNGRRIILSDTVGFISDLPTQLVAAFRATLEEVLDADLIVHVRDAAHPQGAAQAKEVDAILEQLGVSEERFAHMLVVFNKVDLLDADAHDLLRATIARTPNALALSARTGRGVDALISALAATTAEPMREACIELDFGQGRKRAWLFDHNVVVGETRTDMGYRMDVRWSDHVRDQYERL